MREHRLKILVVGLGEVGRDVARSLEGAGHRVTAVDPSTDAFHTFNDVDLAFVAGSGTSPKTLKKAGVRECDLLITCTDNDEINLIGALIGKRLGARTTVARLHSSVYEELVSDQDDEGGVHYDMLGIDLVVNPRVLVTEEMVSIARSHGALDVHFFADRQVELAEMRVHGNSEALGRTLAEMTLPQDTLVGAVIRGGEVFVPRGHNRLELDDRVYLFGRTDRIDEAKNLLFTGDETARVAIYADESIGALLAGGLNTHNIETLLIVEDPAQAELLALELPRSAVLNGRGSDLSLLTEERVGKYDIYFAVTDDDESNLMSGLLAKRLGVERVVCLAQRRDFAELYRELGIDVVLSPRQIAADQIISFTRTEPVENFVHLHDGKAEIIEVIAAEKSPITKKPLRAMSLPEGVFLGGILRGGTVIIPDGNTQVRADDLVVVMTLKHSRNQAQKLFRKGFF